MELTKKDFAQALILVAGYMAQNGDEEINVKLGYVLKLISEKIDDEVIGKWVEMINNKDYPEMLMAAYVSAGDFVKEVII